MKIYQFETKLIRAFFLAPVRMISYKNVPGKEVLLQQKMHGNKGCLHDHAKKGQLIFITPMALFKIQIYKEIFFMKTFQTLPHFHKIQVFFLGLFFFGYIFCRNLFPETLLVAPILFQEKKSQESKTRDFIFSEIFPREFGLFSTFFIYVFFRNFFSWDLDP